MKATTKTCTLEMIDNELIKLTYFDHVEVDLEAAKLDYSHYLNFAQDRHVKNLVVAGKYTQLSTEAMRYIQSQNESRRDKIIAEAIVVHSLAQRMLGNFYYRVLSPKYNVRMFSSEEKAMKWLDSIESKNILSGETA